MGSKSAIGIGNGICFKQVRDKGGGSYIDPLVRDSLVGVWIADQNTNESPTRNIIKNKIKDKGGDLELLNFEYKLNSGYGGYIEDFSLFTLSNRFEYSEISNTKITITAVLDSSTGIYHSVTEEDSALYWNTFKIKVSGSTDDVYISYTTKTKNIRLYNGINTVVVPNELSQHSFSASKANTSCNITLEFVPLYEGALVTDGKDDMIVSQKTIQEMLGGSNVCTVVSMIHQINLSTVASITSINNIRSESVAHVCARHLNTAYGKTGIFGYFKQLNTTNNPTLINNILGDKKDYIAEGDSVIDTTDKYFVQGYKYNDSLHELSEVAIYWTFISNKVLTTDEINQIIGYYKLDKYVTPQVIYDVKRQGLTNDTPEADWYLKDFSGNGHDMQLYNFAKKLDSGIGKYEADYSTWTKTAGVISTPFGLKITEPTHNYWILYTSNITVPARKVKILGIPEGGEFRYLGVHILKNGINELPKMEEHPSAIGFTLHRGTTQPNDWVGLSVEQIPDYEGALVSDGIDDYGKVENLPIYKDYTVVADREIVDGLIDNADGGVATRSYNYAKGAFGFDWKNQAFSFGGNTDRIIDVQRFISYQSKYVNNGIQLITGNVVDNNPLYIARLGEENRYSKLALWSFLLFPYSLSEFLLERQLKRYKLGTLYPDMVEFRPIISSNIPYDKIEFFDEQRIKRIYPGDYVEIGATIKANLYLNNYDISTITSLTSSQFESVYIDRKGQYYDVVLSGIKKSPQKIDITIDECIRYEDIVQPYPAIINLKQDGKTITWGDKLKVGSDIVFVGSANLLPELYTVSETRYNGVTLYPNTIIKVEKSMVFDNARTYLKANEPSCILSPNRLRIPNSSYKILGYIPDLTGKGNHGRLNNFAYTEESGANEDGSICFDGVDDFVTIPTLAHGGKQVLMKVNYKLSNNICTIYDQRDSTRWSPTFCICSNNKTIAYLDGNSGKTYIDGVLNTSVNGKQLANITHNITIANEDVTDVNSVSPKIGTLFVNGSAYAQMALFDFMLFPEISSEEEIKELNECVGIEGNVWRTLTQLINSTLISNETLIKNE